MKNMDGKQIIDKIIGLILEIDPSGVVSYIPEQSLTYDNKQEQIYLSLEYFGQWYQNEIYIDSAKLGFSTNDATVLCAPEDLEYDFFWYCLNKIGVYKDDVF